MTTTEVMMLMMMRIIEMVMMTTKMTTMMMMMMTMMLLMMTKVILSRNNPCMPPAMFWAAGRSCHDHLDTSKTLYISSDDLTIGQSGTGTPWLLHDFIW